MSLFIHSFGVATYPAWGPHFYREGSFYSILRRTKVEAENFRSLFTLSFMPSKGAECLTCLQSWVKTLSQRVQPCPGAYSASAGKQDPFVQNIHLQGKCCRKFDSGRRLAFSPIQLHWQQSREFVLYLADFCMDLSAGSGLGGVQEWWLPLALQCSQGWCDVKMSM